MQRKTKAGEKGGKRRERIVSGLAVGAVIVTIVVSAMYPAIAAVSTADYGFEELPENSDKWNVGQNGYYDYALDSTYKTEGNTSYRLKIASTGTEYGRYYLTTNQTGIINQTDGFDVSFDFRYKDVGTSKNSWANIILRDGNKKIVVQPLFYEGRWDGGQGYSNGITGGIVNNSDWNDYGADWSNMTWGEWARVRIYSTGGWVYVSVNGTIYGKADIVDTWDTSNTYITYSLGQSSDKTPRSTYWLDNLNVDDYQEKAVVSGRVYNENNEDVEGAIVLANDSGVWVEKRLTNSSGEYSMELEHGNYTLEAWADNHSYVKKDIEVTGDMTVDFLLVSSDNRLYGNVENETGGAIQGANITVALADGTVIDSDLSASTGFYEITGLENGTFNVTVTHPDYNNIETSINFTDNVQRDFIMSKPGYKIDGWVEDGGGDGLGNSTITIENSSGVVETVFPTSQGYYLSTGLDSGTYNITASHPDFKEKTKQTTLGPDSTVNFTLAKINKSFYHVSGNITNETDGSAVDDAIVVAENSSGIVGADQTDPGGNYYIGALRNGSYTLRVAAAGYEQESVDFTIDGGNKTIDVALVGNTSASSNEVYGVVTNRSGPVEGATVEIGLGGYVLGVDQTDANGKYSIPGIGDGKYKMKASKQGHWPSEKQVQVSGDTKIDFEIYIPKIRIEVAHHYMQHGSKQGYTVYIDTGHKRIPITNDSDLTVFSENTTIATVNEANNTILATNDTSINARVDIVAEYAGINDTGRTYVAVANNTVAQLPVLPPARRVSATVGDTTMFGLILMIWAAVVGSRWTNAFGGLGFGTIGGITLWYAGYLSTGFMLLTVFSALFLGMNIATNIEYSVQR